MSINLQLLNTLLRNDAPKQDSLQSHLNRVEQNLRKIKRHIAA